MSRLDEDAYPELVDLSIDIEDDYEHESLVVCQGCGAVRGMAYLNKPHACHRNADGSYEEGGTFQ